jgi:hypothetical protein
MSASAGADTGNQLSKVLTGFRETERPGDHPPAAAVRVECIPESGGRMNAFCVRNMWEAILFLLSDQAGSIRIRDVGSPFLEWALEVRKDPESERGFRVWITAAGRTHESPDQEAFLKFVLERLPDTFPLISDPQDLTFTSGSSD